MKTSILLLASVAVMAASSCALQQTTFYKAPGFNAGGSIKVITLNTNDMLSGRIEHFLLINNFRVISDNSFRLPTGLPGGIFPTDTTVFRPGQMIVNIPYMEEKPSDYILRYQFDNAEDSRARSSLSMAVVGTQTGQVEVSYLTQQTGRMDLPVIDRTIRNVIARMKR